MILKSVLRKEMKQRLKTFPAEQFYDEGVSAASVIRGLSLWSRYKTILLFLNDPLEIDTGPLMEAAFLAQKQVFVPKTEVNDIRFFHIYSSAGPWRYGAFDIREPETERPEDVLQAADFPVLVIVPGVAFDRNRNRMGHGKGYYDRFFAKLDEQGASYVTLGLCMEAQLVPEVPTETWDKKMNALCAGSIYIEEKE